LRCLVHYIILFSVWQQFFVIFFNFFRFFYKINGLSIKNN
jgi:hypothetical protein